MRLVYFAAPGRAETSRIILRYADRSFEDVTFDGREWATVYKAQSPTGQCPWLETDDGEVICQSTAIEAYVASLTGLMPTDPLRIAKTFELRACLDDAMQPLFSTFAISDPEEKIAKRREMLSKGGAIAKKLEIVEKMVASRKTAFYLTDDEPTYIDIFLFSFLSSMTSGNLDGITREDLMKYPACMALRNAVASLDKISAQYATAEGSRAAFLPDA